MWLLLIMNYLSNSFSFSFRSRLSLSSSRLFIAFIYINSFSYFALNLVKKSDDGIFLKPKQKSVPSWICSIKYCSKVLYWFFFQKAFMDSAVLSGRIYLFTTLVQKAAELIWTFFWLVINSKSIIPSIIVYFFFFPKFNFFDLSSILIHIKKSSFLKSFPSSTLSVIHFPEYIAPL